MKRKYENPGEKEYWGKKIGGTFVKSEFRKRMEEFTGCNDLVEAQRNKNSDQANKIAKEALRSVYCKLRSCGENWRELTQEKFDTLFGVRQIVMAAGLGSRYSSLIHKAVATGGTGRSNIELAMEGSFQSPTIAPLILVNPKILGLVVKGEYLEGYDEEKGSFIIRKDVLEQLEYQLISSKSVYTDRDLIKRYFGRDDILLCYLPVPLGPGGDLLEAVKLLRENGLESPYVEIVYGEMPTVVLPEYTNASLTVYLTILGGDYLVVVGAKCSNGNIEFKGNFAFNRGRLAAHEDWERIPHEKFDEKEQTRFDRVQEQQGDNCRIIKGTLAEVRKHYREGRLNDAELLERVEELREKYPYFVISDEGELFSQERLLEIRDILKNWSILSEKEKEYLKRNYAVSEARKETGKVTADLMISANTGIFKTDVILRFHEELLREFVEKGYSAYTEALKSQEPVVDNRRVGRFWGVDWKSGRSKAIIWSFSRIIKEWWRAEHPGEDVPVRIRDVTRAPSSIKDAERQFQFTNCYRDVYSLRKMEIDVRWRDILELGKESLKYELLKLLKSDIDSYRKTVNTLFLISKGIIEQKLRVFSVLRMIEEETKGKNAAEKSFSELIRGIHLNAVVEAIDRDYFGPELVKVLYDNTAGEAVSYYLSVLYYHPGSGYIKAKLDRLFREAFQSRAWGKTDVGKIVRIDDLKTGREAKMIRDVRPLIGEKIKKALEGTGRTYYVREGGFASIDINMGIDKAGAITNLLEEQNIDLEASIYFGDEFELNGNDTPVTNLKRGRSTFCIVSVGLDPPSDEVVVEWVGGGPECTKGIVRRILEELEIDKSKTTIVIADEKGIQAEVKVDLKKLRERGSLIFDVDGTILQGREFTFYTDKEARDLFKELLNKGVKVGIISGNSRVEQSSRIVGALEEAGADVENLVLYANGGATRVVYKKGKETVKNLADPIPQEDIEIMKKVVEECAHEQFGLSAEELMAWRDFYGAEENGIGKREGFPELDARWLNKEEWAVDIVDIDDIREEKVARVSCPWIEVRDGVQVSVRLLPKRLEIL